MDDGTGGGLYLLMEGPIVVQHVVVPLGVAPERCTGQHRATRPDQHRGGAALSFCCHSLALVQQTDSQIMVSGMPDTQMRQPWFMGTQFPSPRQLGSSECEKSALREDVLKQHNQARSQVVYRARKTRHQHTYKPGGSACHLSPDAGNSGHCLYCCRKQANTQSPLAYTFHTWAHEPTPSCISSISGTVPTGLVG